MFGDILVMLGVLAAAMMSPGPDMMLVMRYALKDDLHYAFYCSLGICAGLVFHVGLAVFGLGALMAASPIVFTSVRLLGAAYLVFIGWKILSARPNLEEARAAQKMPYAEAFRHGFLTNIFNPKVTIFMLALFSQIITPDYGPAQKMIFITVLFPAVLSIWMIFALLIRRPFLLKSLKKHQRRLNIGFGAVLIILGLFLAVSS